MSRDGYMISDPAMERTDFRGPQVASASPREPNAEGSKRRSDELDEFGQFVNDFCKFSLHHYIQYLDR